MTKKRIFLLAAGLFLCAAMAGCAPDAPPQETPGVSDEAPDGVPDGFHETEVEGVYGRPGTDDAYLTGVLRAHPDPGDAEETYYTLELSQTAYDYLAGQLSTLTDKSGQLNPNEIQIVAQSEDIDLTGQVDQRIVFTGRFYPAYTPKHYRNLIFDVSEVRGAG